MRYSQSTANFPPATVNQAQLQAASKSVDADGNDKNVVASKLSVEKPSKNRRSQSPTPPRPDQQVLERL